MKNIQVFVSSTFRDLQEERSALINSAFRCVKYWGKQAGVSVNPIDLRWGIPQDSSEQTVVDHCLLQVDKSYPYFMLIVGNQEGQAPSFSGGRTYTELEVEKFIELTLSREEPPNGMAFFRKNQRSAKLQSLFSKLKATRGWKVYEFEEINDLNMKVLNAWREVLAPSATDNDSDSNLSGLIASGYGEIWKDEANSIVSNLGVNKIIRVDSDDEMARLTLLSEVASIYQGQGHDVFFMDVVAEGIGTFKNLFDRLKSIEVLPWFSGQLLLKPVTEDQLSKYYRLVIIHNIDKLLDFQPLPRHDGILASDIVLGLQQAALSQAIIISADFSGRSDVHWNEFSTINPVFDDARRDKLIEAMLSNAGKNLAASQFKLISRTLSSRKSDAATTVAQIDNLIRDGRLSETGVSQDQVVNQIIQHHVVDPKNLAESIITDLRTTFPQQSDQVLDWLSLIVGLKFGASFNDCSSLSSEGISEVDWAVFRSIVGESLQGYTRRVQIISAEMRSAFTQVLGIERIQSVTKPYLEQLLAATVDQDLIRFGADDANALLCECVLSDALVHDASAMIKMLHPAYWIGTTTLFDMSPVLAYLYKQISELPIALAGNPPLYKPMQQLEFSLENSSAISDQKRILDSANRAEYSYDELTKASTFIDEFSDKLTAAELAFMRIHDRFSGTLDLQATVTGYVISKLRAKITGKYWEQKLAAFYAHLALQQLRRLPEVDRVPLLEFESELLVEFLSLLVIMHIDDDWFEVESLLPPFWNQNHLSLNDTRMNLLDVVSDTPAYEILWDLKNQVMTAQAAHQNHIDAREVFARLRVHLGDQFLEF